MEPRERRNEVAFRKPAIFLNGNPNRPLVSEFNLLKWIWQKPEGRSTKPWEDKHRQLVKESIHNSFTKLVRWGEEQWISRLPTTQAPVRYWLRGWIMAHIDAAVQRFACVWTQHAQAMWMLNIWGARSLKHITSQNSASSFTHHGYESRYLISHSWAKCALSQNDLASFFSGNVNKIMKCLCSHFTDRGMFYTLWQELVWGFMAVHKYLYLKSAEILFDCDSWTRLKQESLPFSCSSLSLMTAGSQLIFYMFDLHTDKKPKMTAAVDKELHFVKSNQVTCGKLKLKTQKTKENSCTFRPVLIIAWPTCKAILYIKDKDEFIFACTAQEIRFHLQE